MLFTKNDSQSYITTFRRKFTNFVEKAPLLLSFTTSPLGVQVINEDKDDIYSFDWDYTIPVKNFIYGIKQSLIKDGCYPYLDVREITVVPLTRDEQVELIESGINIDLIPTTKTIEDCTVFMIDKVVSHSDRFVIENVDTGQKYLYAMSKSCIFFLQDMKRGKLNEVTGATFFFKHSVLINEIIVGIDG